jgi:hypothetical protein
VGESAGGSGLGMDASCCKGQLVGSLVKETPTQICDSTLCDSVEDVGTGAADA